jgi:hypothetical protein
MRVSTRALKPAVPLALVALLGGPLVWRLVSVPPPDPIIEPLSTADPAVAPRAVALDYAGRTAGADVFQMQLVTSQALDLAAVDEIQLTMATNATAAVLLEAWLSLDGTPCRFRTAPGTVLVDNALLAFRRQPSCAALEGSPTGDLHVEVRLDMGTGQALLWTHEPPATGRVQVVVESETLTLHGQTLTWPPAPTRPRIALLAYLWQVTPPVLWARLRTTAAVILLGLVLLLWPVPSARRVTAVVSAAFGTALVMSGLALGHAVLFPPLQAPDEPDHMLSLARLRADKVLAADIVALARRNHFERLRHHSYRGFRDHDIRRPWLQPLAKEIAADTIERRSPVTESWWNIVGARGAASTAQHLWQLRRANAILFGISCGFAIAILGAALPRSQAAAFSLAVLAVPTLPFFGSYFSDAAVLASISVLLAGCVAVLVIGSHRDHWVGVPLALGLVLAWIAGRALWPLVIAVGSVLAGRALTRQAGRPRLAPVLAFWIPVTLGVGGGVALAARAGLFEYLDRWFDQLSGSSMPFRTAALLTPWVAACLPMALGAFELLAPRFAWDGKAFGAFSRGIAVAMAAWLVGGLLLSLVIAFPQSTPPTGRGGLFNYAVDVLSSMAVPFRLLHHDQLLSTFFWSGMGWVDIVAPVWVMDLAIGATVATLVWSLLQARADAARVPRYALLTVGLAISLAVYAAGAYGLTYALYGRYLVGWYLLLVMTAWTAPALSMRPWWPWLVGALAVHAYYLQSIPVRYF